MSHKFSVRLLAAFSVSVLLSSCGPPRPSAAVPAPVHQAVVADLDVVAKAMGRDVAIQKQVERATSSLNTQLIQAAQAMQGQLEKARAEFGDQPTPEQQERLRQLAAVANQNVRTNKLIARTRQQEIQEGLIREFRNEVRPVAERLARQRRASVVLLSSDKLLWFDPAADITDELIAELRAAALSPSAAPSNPSSPSAPAPAVSSPVSPATTGASSSPRPASGSSGEIVPASSTGAGPSTPATGTVPPGGTRAAASGTPEAQRSATRETEAPGGTSTPDTPPPGAETHR